MTQLAVLLSKPDLKEAALQAAAAHQIPVMDLMGKLPDAVAKGPNWVVLVDSENLFQLTDWDWEVPLLLVLASSSEALEATQRTRPASMSGLLRANHLTDDLRDLWQLVRPEATADLGAVSALVPYLVQLDSCHALPNDLSTAFAAARALKLSLQFQVGAGAAVSARCAAVVFEALENAMCHGNLELSSGLKQPATAEAYTSLLAQRQRQSPYRDRRVWLTTRIVPHAVHVTVRDEGQGFDVSRWHAGPDVYSPPSIRSARSEPGGRGWLVLRHFCSVVRYNSVGNEVTLTIPLTESLSTPLSPSSAVIASSSLV